MILGSGRLGEIADFLAELSEICNEYGIFLHDDTRVTLGADCYSLKGRWDECGVVAYAIDLEGR